MAPSTAVLPHLLLPAARHRALAQAAVDLLARSAAVVAVHVAAAVSAAEEASAAELAAHVAVAAEAVVAEAEDVKVKTHLQPLP